MRSLLHLVLLLVLPPLAAGLLQKTKSWFAGRSGPPLLQPYADLAKLLRKGAVYSRTTTWVFRAGPLATLASLLAAGFLVPLAAPDVPFAFAGDAVLFAYLLALGRFFTMAAALDTGSSFEGMGASREGAFSALTEPALFLALAVPMVVGRTLTLAGALRLPPGGSFSPPLLAAAAALFVVLLAEASRIPVDDPATHLELTMIHEVQVLDHGGVDLGLIDLASSIRLFVFGAILVHLLVPFPADSLGAGAGVLVAGELALAALVGLVESVMGRLRLVRVPQFLAAASVLAAVGLAVAFLGGRA